jgi:protocatechuate 3,4-dioxygenase, beta subunit
MAAGLDFGRRGFIGAVGAAFFTTRGLFAEQLVQTAGTTAGPFYPDRMPLDTDNDLLIINDAITPAVGEITHLTGRVLSSTGQPLRNVVVEIWQVDNKASYIHTGGANTGGRDGNFQGYGRFLTGSTGDYYFRTIKPLPYTLNRQFRAPHIHVGLRRNGKQIFTTQMGINGHKDNAIDSIWKRIGTGLPTLLVDFKPMPGSKIGELTAHFDIRLGKELSA